MYKWHFHSAIGRGRPLAGDLSKVADGIASSLRQFHISASAQAENGGDANPLSRTQRAAAAAAEISSLKPAPVDARSLAAKPPPTFTIRRVSFRDSADSGGRGGLRGPSPYMGRSSRGTRGGGMHRGSGRGGRGARGRGGARKRGSRKKHDDLSAPDTPYTAEEQAYLDGVAMGILTPATVGITTREALEKDAPALATSTAPIGFTATIRDRMRALAGQYGNEYLSSDQHGERYRKGNGTFFVDRDDKAHAIGPERGVLAPKKYDTLDDAEMQALWKILVGGEYQSIRPAAEAKTVDIVESYGQRNESYLQRDISILKTKVQRMLPAPMPANPTAQTTGQ